MSFNLCVTWGVCAGMFLAAQTPSFVQGQVTERVVSTSDPDMTYALYLPSSYTSGRRWPVLLIMDPRGRALVPLKLFQQAAERRGYILASSYDTASDGPLEPNARALRAVLPDLRDRLAIDPARLYLAGFSGTARAAWDFGMRLSSPVAGVIGIGGGLPGPGIDLQKVRFGFFGAAGDLDFNWEEMRALDLKLESGGLPHRFETFPGPHSWPPEAVCAEAIDWMDLHAMRRGLTPKDSELVEASMTHRMREAARLEKEGRRYEAYRAYKAVAADFEGLADTSAPRRLTAELSSHSEVRKTAARLDALAAKRNAYDERLASFLSGYDEKGPSPHAEAVRLLQIRSLQRRAKGTEDRLDALAAQRMLEQAFVHTAFYAPRQWLELGNAARALALLRIAEEIHPAAPQVCYGQARAHAKLGQEGEALEALRCATADAGPEAADAIQKDIYLAPLAGTPALQKLIESLRARPAPQPAQP